MKKYIFIFALFFNLAAGLAGQYGLAGSVFLCLFFWIAVETHLRQRFRFLVGPRVSEIIIDAPGVVTVTASPKGDYFLAWGSGGAAMLRWPTAAVAWQRPLDGVPLAVLPLDDGSLIYALEDEVVRVGPLGQGGSRRRFAPPLYRQSYKLQLSQDGLTLALHTPWFVKIMPSDLSADGFLLKWEEASHYLKYLVLSPDGTTALVAGALLLEDSPGIEARWTCYHKQEGGEWTLAWNGAYESYNNTHLRGLQSLGDGRLYLAEVYQEGYELRFFDQTGQAVWKRSGEHPVFDKGALWMLWENPLEGLTLTEWKEKSKRWTLKTSGPIRWKCVGESGASLCLEGQCLVWRDVDGKVVTEAFFVNNPDHWCVAGNGERWVVRRGDKLGFVRLSWWDR